MTIRNISKTTYNGLGNRLQQSQNGQTTTYALDLNAGLTQVLSDGTNTYLYGYDRIAQSSVNGMEYFLPDALSSVRQMADAVGGVTLSQSFTPYGELLARGGIGSTAYDFAGEWTDPSGLQYLRARYYAPQTGRFISCDPWSGNVRQPASLNRYMYVQGNPVNFSDPSGLCRPDDYACQKVAVGIIAKYNIKLAPLNPFPFLSNFSLTRSLIQAKVDLKCYPGELKSNGNYNPNDPYSYWTLPELKTIDSVLEIFKYFLDQSRTPFSNNLGNGRVIIQKILETGVFDAASHSYMPATSKNPVSFSQIGDLYFTNIYSVINLPLTSIQTGGLIDFGATLSHELMHAYDNSYTTIVYQNREAIYTYGPSTNPVWNLTTRPILFSSNSGSKCGGTTDYSCANAGENFADSSAVYVLNWVKNNTPAYSDLNFNARMILGSFKDAAGGTLLARPPTDWTDYGLRSSELFNLFGLR